jgi:hypothetical protein
LSCQKNSSNQVCTALFATVGVHYLDVNNNPVIVSNFKVLDLRTNTAITHIIPPNYVASNYMEVVDDNDKKYLSTAADNLQVTATNPSTGQTKTVILKISGGTNCHVTKISGPDTIRFD